MERIDFSGWGLSVLRRSERGVAAAGSHRERTMLQEEIGVMRRILEEGLL